MDPTQARHALLGWLKSCHCENGNHQGPYDQRLLVYLRPAIMYTCQADVTWLEKIGQVASSKQNMIDMIRSVLIYYSYDYSVAAPILCEDCAKRAGLVILPDWPIATIPVQPCSRCGAIWDHIRAEDRGAVVIDGKDRLCLDCYKDGQRDLLEEPATSKKDARAERDRIRRDNNDRMIQERLGAGACKSCGSVDNLSFCSTSDSPPGTLAQWRRDCSNDTLAKRLDAMVILCEICLSKEEQNDRTGMLFGGVQRTTDDD